MEQPEVRVLGLVSKAVIYKGIIMAEFDFLNNQTQQNQADPFLPVIPDVPEIPTLDPKLLQSLDQSKQAQKVNNENERQRLDEEALAATQARRVTSHAQNQISQADESMWLDFVGIFDDDYNRAHQRGRIKKATQAFNFVVAENEIERKRDALDLKDAQIDLDAQKTVMAFKKQKAEMSFAVFNAMHKNNEVKKQTRSILQDRAPHEAVMACHLDSSKCNNIVDTRYATDYALKLQASQNTAEAARLANASNRVDLTQKLKLQTMNQMPLAYQQKLFDYADI